MNSGAMSLTEGDSDDRQAKRGLSIMNSEKELLGPDWVSNLVFILRAKISGAEVDPNFWIPIGRSLAQVVLSVLSEWIRRQTKGELTDHEHWREFCEIRQDVFNGEDPGITDAEIRAFIHGAGMECVKEARNAAVAKGKPGKKRASPLDAAYADFRAGVPRPRLIQEHIQEYDPNYQNRALFRRKRIANQFINTLQKRASREKRPSERE
jgi:hypothetical protein